jgi:hypothetical protein
MRNRCDSVSSHNPETLAIMAIWRGCNVKMINIHPTRQTSLGAPQAQEGPMTVFVYINTAKQLGDVDYVKVFGGR